MKNCFPVGSKNLFPTTEISGSEAATAVVAAAMAATPAFTSVLENILNHKRNEQVLKTSVV